MTGTALNHYSQCCHASSTPQKVSGIETISHRNNVALFGFLLLSLYVFIYMIIYPKSMCNVVVRFASRDKVFDCSMELYI